MRHGDKSCQGKVKRFPNGDLSEASGMMLLNLTGISLFATDKETALEPSAVESTPCIPAYAVQ